MRLMLLAASSAVVLSLAVPAAFAAEPAKPMYGSWGVDLTARDLSVIASHIISDFPEYYTLYSIRKYRFVATVADWSVGPVDGPVIAEPGDGSGDIAF